MMGLTKIRLKMQRGRLKNLMRLKKDKQHKRANRMIRMKRFPCKMIKTSQSQRARQWTLSQERPSKKPRSPRISQRWLTKLRSTSKCF